MASKHIVVSINGDLADVRVSCICGWKPSMGGAIEYIIPMLKTFMKKHRGQPGHELHISDPHLLLHDTSELPLLS
jgi:hypothetical protein